MANSFIKDPDAVLDYTINWANWLSSAETISTSTWLADSGITMDSDTNDSTTATVWLSGGTRGIEYQLTNRITTTEGRTDDRSLSIFVEQR